MILFPAIDLRDGQVVRLTQGDYDQMKVYASDPLEVAKSFAAAGATHLHVVDLDGAKAGMPQNAQIIGQLAKESGLFVQTGGGLRTPQAVEAVLEQGVGRVILGTAALKNPAFLREMLAQYGERIAVGVDAKDGKVATGGWLETSDMDAMAFCRNLRDQGISTVIYTDIARDGKLSGTNLPAYEALSTLEELQIIASGGITDVSEIAALRAMGIYGAILGKALYEGRLNLREALSAAGEVGA